MDRRVVAPWRGEFGLKIRYHVPTTYALEPGYLAVIEDGEQALYPGASEFWIVPRRDDIDRHGDAYDKDPLVEQIRRVWGPHVELLEPKKGDPEKRFVPTPHVDQGVDGVEVVICPREREYGAEKNWPYWETLLSIPGVFAAGAPDSSYDLDCPNAWDHDRFLDATIQAMLQAKLVVSTDAGLAHLALLCGRPLLLLTHKGLVAPGPVKEVDGRISAPAYWPVRMDEYYHAANHRRVLIHEHPFAWVYPDDVRTIVEDLLCA